MNTLHKRRPGGNFTQPDHDWHTHQIQYHIWVGWVRQPEAYETEMEASNALRAATARRPDFECVIDESAGLAG